MYETVFKGSDEVRVKFLTGVVTVDVALPEPLLAMPEPLLALPEPLLALPEPLLALPEPLLAMLVLEAKCERTRG